MDRPTVLVMAVRYLPGFRAGGPIRSIASMVEALGDEFDFRVVAYDRDIGDTAPYPSAAIGNWQQVGRGLVWWVRPDRDDVHSLRAVIDSTEHRLLYLNTFFDPLWGFGLLKASSTPVLLAPRGQFGEGAMAQKNLRKQMLVRFLYLRRRLRSVLWHATADEEAQNIRGTVGAAARVFVAGNLPDALPEACALKRTKEPGVLKVCFLSRISPKKNLLGALRMIRQVEGDVSFDIFGPLEDPSYWSICQAEMKRLPANVKASYLGELKHEDVGKALAEHDLFFLPTRNENFGHVIYEALANGCPVLISDQTPWRQLQAREAGWDLPLSEEGSFVAALQHMVAIDDSVQARYCEGARSTARAYLQGSDAVAATRSMLLSAIEAR